MNGYRTEFVALSSEPWAKTTERGRAFRKAFVQRVPAFGPLVERIEATVGRWAEARADVRRLPTGKGGDGGPVGGRPPGRARRPAHRGPRSGAHGSRSRRHPGGLPGPADPGDAGHFPVAPGMFGSSHGGGVPVGRRPHPAGRAAAPGRGGAGGGESAARPDPRGGGEPRGRPRDPVSRPGSRRVRLSDPELRRGLARRSDAALDSPAALAFGACRRPCRWRPGRRVRRSATRGIGRSSGTGGIE